MPSSATQFDWTQSPLDTIVCDGLILLVPQPQEGATLSWDDGLLEILNTAKQGVLQTTATEEKFLGKKDQLLAFRQYPGDKLSARRLLLVGIGPLNKLTSQSIATAVEKATAPLTQLEKLYNVTLILPPDLGSLSQDDTVIAAVDAFYQATYVSQESKDPPASLLQVDFWSETPPPENAAELLHLAQVLADARSFAKDLVNKPPNLKSTQTMADIAAELDECPNVVMEILSDIDWIKENMPAFYAVARGSLASDPPKFIHLKYTPAGGTARKKIALVGKTVIFDTGGYQVKTDNFMNTMKGDMTGGAMVLGTLRAIAELQPPHVELSVYLAATPNKIDSDAYLPDSIIDSACGKKIEVRHTDAEGRLTLMDAVTKAADNKPDMILTIATLTGAAMRAVGCHIALMGNDLTWRNKVEAIARKLGEPIQPLDVVEEDYDNIKSKLDGADLINTSKSKFRGAQSAAAFVMRGAPEDMPMVHLDIAGADMSHDEKATGIGQRTLIQFVLD